jgi:hypothetical protein
MVDFLEVEPGFYDALGRFTAIWAYVEMGADSTGTIIFHHYGGKTIRPNIPYSLDKKIEYLREAFRTLPPLGPFATEGIKAVEKFASLRTDRHDFIHGLHGKYINDRGEAVSGRIRYVPDNLHMLSRRVTVADIQAVIPAATWVAKSFLVLAARLAKPMLADKAAGKAQF